MKLNEVQRFQLRQALDNATRVLREIKQKPLKSSALKDMKHLEDAVSTLEALVIGS